MIDRKRTYYVYILANKSRMLYVGVTGNLPSRLGEHQHKTRYGYAERYNIAKLVWFEAHDNPMGAIEREKEIKGWRRSRKIDLVERQNPEWRDLTEEATGLAPPVVMAEVRSRARAKATAKESVRRAREAAKTVDPEGSDPSREN